MWWEHSGSKIDPGAKTSKNATISSTIKTSSIRNSLQTTMSADSLHAEIVFQKMAFSCFISQTIKRTRRRPRPHTCTGTRTEAGGSIDSGAESDDTRNKGSEFDFTVDILDEKGWDTDLEIEGI